MLENIRLSFQGIWSHKMRSFLTMLGVIIGIASIIAIVSTIKGTNEQIKQNLIGAGTNNVTITPESGRRRILDGQWNSGGCDSLSDDIKEGIRALDHVENASFFNSRTYVDGISNGDTRLDSGKAYGIDQQYLDTCGYVVSAGRGFIDGDYQGFRKVVLLDTTAASALFQEESALGKTIEIRESRLRWWD